MKYLMQFIYFSGVRRMIRIIDNTLSCLDSYNASPHDLYQLLESLLKLPTAYIEMSASVYEKLSSIKMLPQNRKYLLHVASAMQADRHQGFAGYIMPAESFGKMGNAVYEINFKTMDNFVFDEKCIQGLRIVGFAERMAKEIEQEIIDILASKEKFEFCPKNDYFCATALAFEWCRLGGQKVIASFAGIGNQAGLEELLVALHLENLYKIKGDLSCCTEIKCCLERITGQNIAHNKAVIGESIFAVEAGIHVDGIIKNPNIYEPYPPEFVGNQRHIIMGQYSGRNAVLAKMKELHLPENDVDLAELVAVLQHKSLVLQKNLTDAEFANLVRLVK